MFSKIILENFQIHKKTILNLVPGLNVIIGSSDNGKSSIERAVELVGFNRPNGTSYIRRGSDGNARVSIKGDGGTVQRIRGKGKNEYKVNGETFKALGSDVPEGVKTALGLSKINVQGQFDSFFLLQDSPGQVAKELNKVVGIDIIDRVLKGINKIVTSEKTDKVRFENSFDDKITELREYDYLDEIATTVHSLPEWLKEYNELRGRYRSLREYLLNLRSISESLKKYTNIKILEESIGKLNLLLVEQQLVDDETSGIEYHLLAIEDTDEEMVEADKLLEAEEEVNQLVKTFKTYQNITDKIKKLNSVMTSIDNIDSKEIALSKSIITQEKSIKEAEALLGICPYCQQEIK